VEYVLARLPVSSLASAILSPISSVLAKDLLDHEERLTDGRKVGSSSLVISTNEQVTFS
jgi:hypothetical protein